MGKIDKKTEESMKGKLLVALPSLHSSCFEKSVIYMCNHDSSGAMGIIINHTISDMDFSSVLKQFNLEQKEVAGGSVPVHFGGPVDIVRGFILHSPEYHVSETFKISDIVSLTANPRVLKDISLGIGPKKKILAVGYAGWGAGQLESEIARGSWFTVPATEEIVFGENDRDKWKLAALLTGITDPFKFSHEVGHA